MTTTWEDLGVNYAGPNNSGDSMLSEDSDGSDDSDPYEDTVYDPPTEEELLNNEGQAGNADQASPATAGPNTGASGPDTSDTDSVVTTVLEGDSGLLNGVMDDVEVRHILIGVGAVAGLLLLTRRGGRAPARAAPAASTPNAPGGET